MSFNNNAPITIVTFVLFAGVSGLYAQTLNVALNSGFNWLLLGVNILFAILSIALGIVFVYLIAD